MAKTVKMQPAHKPEAAAPAALAPGQIAVNEADYEKLIETTQTLIEQKRQLGEMVKGYREDITTVVNCLLGTATGGLFSGEGFSVASVMKIVQNKDVLIEQLKPLGAFLTKYTTDPATATAQNG